MFRRAFFGLLVSSLSLLAADAPKPAAKEAGQLDPKQFQAVCAGADVIVLGKAYAILTGTLDSEPPTPVYTTAKLQTKNLKFLKGREKLGDKPSARVEDAFEELGQPAVTLMDKTVLVAFQWDGKNLKLKLLSTVNATDLALILEKYPEAK